MRSIRVYLFALVAICAILAASAFGLIAAQADQLSRRQAETQARETAKALSQAVDRELERAIGVLAALGASEAASVHDWGKLDRQARAALRDVNAWIVVQDRSGRQLVNTRLAPGTALPAAPVPVEMWKEIENGNPRVCNLVSGIVEPRIACVDAPIGRGPAVDYAISMIFRPSAFGPIITRENVGAGNIAVLVDRNGRVIWRNRKPEDFVGHYANGKMLEALRSGAKSGVLESTSLEGVHMLSAFNRSALSGWSVIAGTPIKEVEATSRQALWRGSMVTLIILLLGTAFAALLGARLVSAVNALVNASEPDGQTAKSTGIAEVDAVAKALRNSFSARAQSERHQQMLVGELNHRVKNTLAIVQSLAHQTFRGRSSPADAIAAFEARLQALAGAHNLLTKQRWESASMRQIVESAVAPFCGPERCVVEGPDLLLPPQTAVSLALAVHELATNASKYGALSNDAGAIRVTWTTDSDDFVLLWEEKDGPPAQPPKAEGLECGS